MSQAHFLHSLGISTRLEALQRVAAPADAEALRAGYERYKLRALWQSIASALSTTAAHLTPDHSEMALGAVEWGPAAQLLLCMPGSRAVRHLSVLATTPECHSKQPAGMCCTYNPMSVLLDVALFKLSPVLGCASRCG